ncbi:MAG: hypothetical protein ACOC5T_05280 [Elusimicrobiota bacterium]
MNWYKISKKLDTVKLEGKLKQTKDGFVYLDIPDDIISGFLPMINNSNAKKPPYFNKEFNKVGTHISVMSKDETEGLDIKEIGQNISFEIKSLKNTNPEGWNEIKKVYFITIKSKELEDLRQKYNLSKKIDGHEFHITVAVEEKE